MRTMTRALDRLSGKGRERTPTAADLVEQAKAELAEFLERESEERRSELQRTLARERAEASHLLTEQERQFALERRELLESQLAEAEQHLTGEMLGARQRLEERLHAWIDDLDRGQRARETQFAGLAQRQNEALAAYDARLTADAEALEAFTSEQRAQLAKLREDLERMAKDIAHETEIEIETHAAERRRALHEVSERLRSRERAMRELIEREEQESMQRLAAALADAERRQLESLERSLDRATTRIVEEAERRFDEQIRKSRDKSAERLNRELDKAMEQFAARAEKDVAERIAETSRATVERLQRQLQDLTRAAETQQEISAERIRMITERLNEAIAGAETRMVAYQQEIEMELATKIADLERTLRSHELGG
jgi:hypothetical protein